MPSSEPTPDRSEKSDTIDTVVSNKKRVPRLRTQAYNGPV